jgi:hypothetical protein
MAGMSDDNVIDYPELQRQAAMQTRVDELLGDLGWLLYMNNPPDEEPG